MNYAAKEVVCDCGHTFISQREKAWCEKCCSAVYYDEKDSKKFKMNNYYILSAIVSVVTFLTYVFIELIATPILSF